MKPILLPSPGVSEPGWRVHRVIQPSMAVLGTPALSFLLEPERPLKLLQRKGRAVLGAGGRRRSWGGIKLGGPLGIAGDVLADGLVELGPLGPELVGDARLEGVVRVGLDEQLADGLEDGGQLARGLPVLGLEQGDADVAGVVVGHVRVVDARREGHEGRLEGVVGGQLDDQAELARAVDCVGRALEGYVPSVEVGLGGEVDGHARRGVLAALGELLGDAFVGHIDDRRDL